MACQIQLDLLQRNGCTTCAQHRSPIPRRAPLSVGHGRLGAFARPNTAFGRPQDSSDASGSTRRPAICSAHSTFTQAEQLETSTVPSPSEAQAAEVKAITDDMAQKRLARRAQRARQQLNYKISAIVASVGVTTLAVAAVYYRFVWNMGEDGQFPVLEAFCTLLLTFGGVVGMEMWARWAHKALWHDLPGGWKLHKSHHVPRVGAFEDNDIFAIVNAIPAMALCAYGFLTPSMGGGLCFGAGLGITLFGMMYMFIHDGMVHRRFPVGPIAEVPYLQRVAAAHKLHHAEKYEGVPWGLFLGPQELEAVGAKDDLDRMVAELSSVTPR